MSQQQPGTAAGRALTEFVAATTDFEFYEEDIGSMLGGGATRSERLRDAYLASEQGAGG